MKASLFTHTHPELIEDSVHYVAQQAAKYNWRIITTDPNWETIKGIEFVEYLPGDEDFCLVLGGDGTILYALRQYANKGIPIFSINHGTMGFLSAAEKSELGQALGQAFNNNFTTLSLPALHLNNGSLPDSCYAFNDLALTRQPGGRIAELTYMVNGEEVGSVRGDGLVAATPVGSTGYNLANNGPILAWGVKGYVISYISPHSLTARPLIVGPDDELEIYNAPRREAVNIEVDGQIIGQLASGDKMTVSFADDIGTLAESKGQSFYHRISEKFGHLSQ